MISMNKKSEAKKKVIFRRKLDILFIFVCTLFIGIGYASINSISLNLNGFALASPQEGIFITDVTLKENKEANIDVSNILSFHQTNLESKVYLSDTNGESYITYEVALYNSYDVDYVFDGVKYLEEGNAYSNKEITYTLTGLNKGEILKSKTSKSFTITFHYVDQEKFTNNSLYSLLNFLFVENTGPTFYDSITESAVADNISSTYVSSSSGINFHSNSSSSNGQGLYVRANTINDEFPIYYYRGNVSNNNVKFANICWKIVRTTETGGIKLIYNGAPSSITNNCENISVNSQQINMSGFADNSNSPADVGYMLGTRYLHGMQSPTASSYLYGNDVTWNGSSYKLNNTINVMLFGDYLTQVGGNYHYTCLNTSGTCSKVYYIYYTETAAYYLTFEGGKKLDNAKEEMFSNQTSSKIKRAFDAFYTDTTSGLGNYTDKLEDTIWCNDRRTYNGGLHSKDDNASSISFFYNYYKVNNANYVPDLLCERIDDSFSTKISNGGTEGYGNNMLDYPIATLTVDELMLAGLTVNSNTSNYLYTGLYWWTLSPSGYQYYNAYNYVVGQSGEIYQGGLVNHENVGIRPVISLKNNVKLKEGTGTLNDPYIVE